MLKDIIFSIVIGGVVGILGHVRKHGKIIMPRKTKKFIYLGYLEEMLLGAIFSLLLVMYISPDSYVEKLTISISAGIGGDVVLTSYKQFKQKGSE
ncbi:DUF4257 domain-containing protein [Bacillus xiapuensis]|uniref:DUF4257 domain-containing protein n=1 Tax=Bacillus xiapuensis TaxID=2014075 RepID=A0ABU6N8S4_9BACI|nr:DUF4257 domain-containing protein [Bacillus xiapuensis]